MPKLHKLSAVVRILILLALCGLSAAQILYVDDFCDFAGYDGICLEASKCTDLEAKMQALTLESHHVGRCGFGVREEIICCPNWLTPVQTPPKLPNAFIDLSKQPEFVYKPPLDGALSDSSIPITTSTPINFNQNGFFVANPVPNVQNNQNLNGNPVVDENDRFNAIFGVNPEQNGNDNNQDEGKANSFPVVNEKNNGFLTKNPLPNVKDNQNLNGNPVIDENERMNAIFGNNHEQNGNDKSQDKGKANFFPVVNENNNGLFIQNSVPNVQDNQNLNNNPAIDENERMNAIFGNNHEQNGNDNNQDEGKANSFPLVNGNNNGFFITNPLPNVQDNQNINGYPVVDENERMNAIFGLYPEQIGNDNNGVERKGNSFPVVNENNNGFFAANPAPNLQDDHNFNGNPVVDENERINAIFGLNLEQIGNDNSPDEKKANSFPVVNENNNGIFIANPLSNVQDNQLVGYPVIDENERINAIFGLNPEQIGNDNSPDEKKANSFPAVNENNNGIFINQLVGYPVIDENKRINAIFGDNSAQNGNDNNKAEKKANSFPVVNENSNGFFAANPALNVQDNQNLNNNPVIDENERFNAIFGGNREEVGNDKDQEEKKGNTVPVINGNNGIFIANPLPNVQDNPLIGYPIIDENDRLSVIFGDNPEHNKNDESKEETKTNPAPFVNGNNNGFFIATPVPNVQDNGKTIGSPVIDVNERVKAIFGDNPVQVGSGNSKGEEKVNPLPLVNGNNNGISNQNPIPNVEGRQKLNGNPVVDENERFNAIFNGNPLQIEDDRIRPSGVIDQDSAENLKAKINSIFGSNREQIGNANDNEKSNGNSVPVINGNNNGIFNQNPIPIEQSNQKLNGNPVVDENEKFNALFNGSPLPIDDERVGPSGVIDQDSAENLKAKINAIFGGNREEVGNDDHNEKSNGNSVPVINGNNNRIFNQNPIPNVKNNQKLDDNPFFDENERFNAIFNGNPIPKETHIGGLNGVISQNPAIFGGKSVQLGDTNKSEVLNRKPMPGDDELVQNNAAMDGQAIQDEKAFINAILNGQLESSPRHFIFNDRPLRGRPINRRRHGTFMENRSTFNNGRFNMRNHGRFEEATHRRNQGVYRGSSRNTRIRFANN